MHYADEVGLPAVTRTMQEFESSSGDPFWKPAALIERLLEEGKNITI